MIRIHAKPLMGEPIADEIETHGAALMAVQIWMRGYFTAKRELPAKDNDS